jgi:mono/diheme cytochrome c family protein
MKSVVMLLSIASVLSACGRDSDVTSTEQGSAPDAVPEPRISRIVDADSVARGAVLYKDNCAVCHGANAEGASNWHQRGADGKMSPPPLNGTGHAWHHPSRVLRYTILHGTKKLGGNMPGWKGKLGEQDVEDVIAWFQSKWPDAIYNAWLKMEQKDKP